MPASSTVGAPGLDLVRGQRALSRSAWVVALVGLLATASYAWFYYGRGLDVPDEGLLLHVAERLARGEVPYRDVYFIYTPGLQYLLALLFRALGPSLEVEHALLLVLHVALVVVVYVLAARLSRSHVLALLAGAVAAAAGLNSYRFLLGLLSVLVVTLYAESGRRRWLVAGGVLIGTTYLFAQEVGLYALGSALGFLGLVWLGDGSRRKDLRGLLIAAGLVGAGAAAVVGPWLLVLTTQQALVPMLDATVRVAFLHQPRYMHVPLPPLLPIVPIDLSTNVVWGPPPYLLYVKTMLYLPLVAVVTGWLVIGADARCGCQFAAARERGAPARRAALPLLVFATLALATVADRADYYHLRQVLPVALVLLAWLLARLKHRRGAAPVTAALVLLPFLPLLVVSLGEAASFRAEQSVPLRTVRGSVLVDETKARDLAGVLRAVRDQTRPDAAIFVWPAETAIYFLADRRNPTRFGQLVSTELELLREDDGREQRNIITALAEAGVEWGVSAPTENVNGLPFSGYAPLLAEYLEGHFVPVQPYGYWTLQQRVVPASGPP